MTMLQRLFSICALLTLAACGGGGGDAGTPPFGGGSGGGGGTGGGTPTITLALSSPTVGPNTPSTLTVTVRNGAGAAVSGVVVALSTGRTDIGALSAVSVLTDASGVGTAQVRAATAGVLGADLVTATATVSGTQVTGSVGFAVSGVVAGTPTLTLTLSSSTVTATAPSIITATLRDGANAPIANAVVALTTTRSSLSTLSAASILTNTSGVATGAVQSAGSGLEGADDVVATVTLGSTTLTARAGFQVQAQAPTLRFTPSTVSVRSSVSPVALTVRLLDAAGTPVNNAQVRFAANATQTRLEAASALTDATGTATARISPLSPSTTGSDVLTATATVGGRDVQATATVQYIAEAPKLDVISFGSTTGDNVATATSPVTLRVRARGLTDQTVQGAIVSFGSGANLVGFTPASVVTDANGEAVTLISPRTAASVGADTVTASVTVSGVTATAQRVVQVVSTAPTGTPTMDLRLSSTSISAASPATVTATLLNAQGSPVSGQVVTFAVVRNLATTNVATALTNGAGQAVVVLSPASAASAGADEVTASASFSGVQLQKSQGFSVQATPVTLDSFTAATSPLSPYGQTTLTLALTGASVTSPVTINVSSSCVALGKATLSPTSFTATSASVTLQYKDNGCGAVQTSDQLQAVVTATGASRSLSLPVDAPTGASIAFVSAAPEAIYLKGSGFTEASIVTFEVRDAANNPLPGKVVELRLTTGAGNVTMEGRNVEVIPVGDQPTTIAPFLQTSNALGRVSVQINAGTQPTPVRVHARLQGTSIATISSNLSVAIGLPSQLNFSLSQGTKNIEGYNIDGTPNTYQIIAADRSGNPLPNGTSMNFVAEGGQIEAIKQTQLVNGISRATANFVSAEPRPVDGRVTITAYALGEESFIDLNGNNVYDAGEPFQDLGDIFKDRNFDGVYDPSVDEFIPLNIRNNVACASLTGFSLGVQTLLATDASIPNIPVTCSGNYSGAGQVYVRRATETVLATSAARPLWASTAGLSATCTANLRRLQVGNQTTQTARFIAAGGDKWYGGASGTLSFVVADANPGRPKQATAWAVSGVFNPDVDYELFPRLNPMAAGTTISVSTPTSGLTVLLGGGSPVPSTTEFTTTSVAYNFTDTGVTEGVIFVTFTSPSGTGTTISVPVVVGPRPSACAF